MTLLNILHTGGIFEAITVIYLGLSAFWWIRMIKARNSGGIQQHPGAPVLDEKKTPFHQQNMFKLWAALTVFYIIAIIGLAIEYKGV